MELRSGRRLRSSQPIGSQGGGADRISALHDDLLLLILARLRCVATAARTGALSCRWRNLWTLLSALVFRHVSYFSLEPALARVVSPTVSLLKIHVPMILKFHPSLPGVRCDVTVGAPGVTSLLRTAALLQPEELVLALPYLKIHGQVDLPCFRRATSIVLESGTSICFRVPHGAEFAALDTLSLSGNIVGFDNMIARCPRLHVLCLKVSGEQRNLVKVHLPSLQELFVNSTCRAHRVDIVAPVLRQLTISLRPSQQVNISISAPVMETISWQCSYRDAGATVGFLYWRLMQLSLKTAETQGQLASLHIHAIIYLCAAQVANLWQEIEKHIMTDFSALELHLITRGHVFVEFVLHLIGKNQICNAMRRLKVILQRSKVKEACPTNCRCHFKSWEVQTISLIALEEMQIDGLEGEDHEFDFLKLVFTSAPMLKRVIVKLSLEDSSSSKLCSKLHDLFRAYSSVECCVYLSTGEHMSCIHD